MMKAITHLLILLVLLSACSQGSARTVPSATICQAMMETRMCRAK